MKRLIKTVACMLLISIQTFSAAALANIPYTSPLKPNGVLTTAIVPTAFTDEQDQIKDQVRDGKCINISSADLLSLPIKGRSTKGSLNIEQGNLLLNPEKDMQIDTQEASVYIKVGATIFLMQSENGTVIYDLCQTNAKQITVVAGKGVMTMYPGEMLVLTKQDTHQFENLEANCHAIDYRRAVELNLPNNQIKGFAAQFSIVSALGKIVPLHKLAISNEKKDKLCVDRILKIAVAMGSIY